MHQNGQEYHQEDKDDVDIDLYPVDYVDGEVGVDNDIENDGAVKVLINFKLGSMGRSGRAYEHLNSLHDQTRLLGVDITWADAIMQEFGVELDPGRYFMRRVDPSAPQHDLSSPIMALLDEFNTPPTVGEWRVTIIDREQRSKALGPPPKPKPQPPPAKKARLNKTLPTKPAAAGTAAAGTAAAAGGGGSGGGHIIRRKSEQLYRHQPQKTWVVRHNDDYQQDRVRGRGGDLQLQKKANNITFMDHDNDDPSSIYSQESQENVVTPKDDLKSAFLERIRTQLTGEMLLEAEDVLKEQKASVDAVDKRDRWTKWASNCPFPVTILKSLFDV